MIWNIAKLLNFEEVLQGNIAHISKISSGFADPFVWNGWIFCEAINTDLQGKVIDPQKGRRFGIHKGGVIVASKLSSISFQTVLESDKFHMSYPHIFEHKSHIFMIPETFQLGKVQIYKCLKFPHQWEIHSTLIDEPYCDTTAINVGGNLYLVAKNVLSERMDLFHFDGKLIRKDILPEGDRCGGNLIQHKGMNILPIQPKERLHYGERLCLYEITRDLEFRLMVEVEKGEGIESLHHLSNCNGEFYCDFTGTVCDSQNSDSIPYL